jgi:hypothetical protein
MLYKISLSNAETRQPWKCFFWGDLSKCNYVLIMQVEYLAMSVMEKGIDFL